MSRDTLTRRYIGNRTPAAAAAAAVAAAGPELLHYLQLLNTGVLRHAFAISLNQSSSVVRYHLSLSVDKCCVLNIGILQFDTILSVHGVVLPVCLLYTSPSPRDRQKSRMPSSA